MLLEYEKLAVALDDVVDAERLEAGLAQYQPKYAEVYCDRLLKKLGFFSKDLEPTLSRDLISQTLTLLEQTRVRLSIILTLTSSSTRAGRVTLPSSFKPP